MKKLETNNNKVDTLINTYKHVNNDKYSIMK